MEWESESALEFFREDLRKNKEAGVVSSWDLYQEFNSASCSEELVKQRIKHNKAFAERSRERLATLEQAERNGVLVMKI